MQIINSYGIIRLSDLTKNHWQEIIERKLLKEWDNILLFEQSLNPKLLKPTIKNRKIGQWQNPHYWLGLTKQARLRQLKAFKEFKELNTMNSGKQINDILKLKWQELASK